MPRLFVAVELPARVREDIANICYGVPDVRWTPQNQLHLTLHFIGEVRDAVHDDVIVALSEVLSPPFAMRLKGCGYFPPRKDPRVLWLGVEASPALEALSVSAGDALEQIGVTIEKRRFHPHVTIGRVRERAPMAPIGRFISGYNLFSSEVFDVGMFHLFSSVLTAEGAIHSREASFGLRRE